MAEKRKELWVELLRIIACLSVVLIHTASQHFRDISVNSYSWKVSNVFHGLIRFAVPAFIMISGYLYLNEKREITLSKLYKKNIIPITVTFFFWQGFYAVYRVIMEQEVAIGSSDFFKRILIYFSKVYFHLWYMPMLIGLLIIVPLIKVMVNGEGGKKRTEYILILHIIFQVLPVTIGFLPLPQQEYLKNMLNMIKPELVTSYVGYFVLGHYLGTYDISEKFEKGIYLFGSILIVIAVYLCQWQSIRTGRATQVFYENYTIANFLSSAAVFLFCKNYLSRIQWRPQMERFICHLGKCTFGIYLLHALFRDIFFRMGLDSMTINTAIAIPLVGSLVFICSYLAVIIIKKIPVIGKWIV